MEAVALSVAPMPFDHALAPAPSALADALHELAARRAPAFAAGVVTRLPAALDGLTADAHNVAETESVAMLRRHLEGIDPAALQARFVETLLARLAPSPRRGPSRPRLLDFDRLAQTPEEEAEEAAALASLAEGFVLEAGAANCAANAERLAQESLAPGRSALAAHADPALPGSAWLLTLRAAGVPAACRHLSLRPFELHGGRLWAQWQEELARRLAALPMSGSLQADVVEPEVGFAAGPGPALLASLKAMAAAPSAGSDTLLAEALLQRVTHGDGGLAAALGAFGDWFDGIKAEPQLPADCQDDWEALRLPLLTAALQEPAFFSVTLAAAPLRARCDALCRQAALTAVGLDTGATVRAGFRQLQAELDGRAGAVLERLGIWPGLPREARTAFGRQLLREATARAEALLAAVRRAALAAALAKPGLPPAAQDFAAAALVPLLAGAWLRDGRGSSAARAVEALAADWRASLHRNAPPALRQVLERRLPDAWAAAGAEAFRATALLGALRTLWQEAAGGAFAVTLPGAGAGGFAATLPPLARSLVPAGSSGSTGSGDAAVAGRHALADPEAELDSLLAALDDGPSGAAASAAARSTAGPAVIVSQRSGNAVGAAFLSSEFAGVDVTAGNGESRFAASLPTRLANSVPSMDRDRSGAATPSAAPSPPDGSAARTSTPASSVPAAATTHARLARLFRHGRWLRIPEAGGTPGSAARFLGVSKHDASSGALVLTLADAAGQPVLSRAATRLLAELRAGRAELLSPDAETAALLAELGAETAAPTTVAA